MLAGHGAPEVAEDETIYALHFRNFGWLYFQYVRRRHLEHVLWFCTNEQHRRFLKTCLLFEKQAWRAGSGCPCTGWR